MMTFKKNWGNKEPSHLYCSKEIKCIIFCHKLGFYVIFENFTSWSKANREPVYQDWEPKWT